MSPPTTYVATPSTTATSLPGVNPRIVGREIATVLEANGCPVVPARIRTLSVAYCSDAEHINISVGEWLQRRGDLIQARPKPRVSDPSIGGPNWRTHS